MVSFNHVSPAGVSLMIWYHVFGHLLTTDEAPELFADHQDEAELAYDQYAGVMAGARVFVIAHHFKASGNGHAGSLLPEGSATGTQPSYSLSA
jgi:hypothetical protein